MADSTGTVPDPSAADPASVQRYLKDLHDRITAAVEALDTARFRRDLWQRPEGGGGESRVLTDGAIFERAGVSFSHVHGGQMPQSASNLRPEIAGAAFEAMGISLVFHPQKPLRAHHALQCPLSRGDAQERSGRLVVRRRLRSDALLSLRRGRAALAPNCAGRMPAFRRGCVRKIQGLVRPLFFLAPSE